MAKNIFQEILLGKAPANIIYNSDQVLAFHHPNPKYTKHIIVMPKTQVKDISCITGEHEELMWEVVKVAKYIAKTLTSENKGARVITNLGKFQECPSFCFHVISGDEL